MIDYRATDPFIFLKNIKTWLSHVNQDPFQQLIITVHQLSKAWFLKLWYVYHYQALVTVDQYAALINNQNRKKKR